MPTTTMPVKDMGYRMSPLGNMLGEAFPPVSIGGVSFRVYRATKRPGFILLGEHGQEYVATRSGHREARGGFFLTNLRTDGIHPLGDFWLVSRPEGQGLRVPSDMEGKAPVVRKGLRSIGGKHWRCTRCDGVVSADCPCCEPPSCNCMATEVRHGRA